VIIIAARSYQGDAGHLAIAEELAGNVFNLEGHDLLSAPLGFTDTASTTCLHVPSIGLIVVGDAAYNGVGLHLSESPDQQKRQEWIAALDEMESFKPWAMIADRSLPNNVASRNSQARSDLITPRLFLGFSENA
jgi:hypothetical protein